MSRRKHYAVVSGVGRPMWDQGAYDWLKAWAISRGLMGRTQVPRSTPDVPPMPSAPVFQRPVPRATRTGRMSSMVAVTPTPSNTWASLNTANWSTNAPTPAPSNSMQSVLDSLASINTALGNTTGTVGRSAAPPNEPPTPNRIGYRQGMKQMVELMLTRTDLVAQDSLRLIVFHLPKGEKPSLKVVQRYF